MYPRSSAPSDVYSDMYVKHVVLWHTRQCEVMMDHSIICKIHGSRLTIHVSNEVRCSWSYTKILVFLSMKMELLCPLLFVSSCLSSKRFFFPHFRKHKNPDTFFHNLSIVCAMGFFQILHDYFFSFSFFPSPCSSGAHLLNCYNSHWIRKYQDRKAGGRS